MNQLMADPLFQFGLAPLVTVLLIGTILKRWWPAFAGISVILAFYLSAWLITGLDLFPLTSTRKIILLAGVALLVGVALDLYKGPRRYLPLVLFTAGAIAALWIVWPVLMRKHGSEFWLLGLGAVIYSGWLMAFFSGLQGQTLRFGCAATTLAAATGASALMGASALYGGLGFALATASVTYLLLSLFSPGLPSAFSLTIPVVLLCGLLGTAANVFAKLPWFSLPFLALIPLLAFMPIAGNRMGWIKAPLLLIAMLPAAGAAVFMSWWVNGLPPL